MKANNSIKNLGAILLLIIVFFASCNRFRSEKKYKVSAHVWPGYEPLFFANTQNLWDKDDIRLIEYQSASQSLRAFQNGVIDMAALTLDEALLLASQGEEIEVVSILDYSNGADAIIAGPDIRKLTDLKRKRIGYEDTALGAFLLGKILEKAGLEPSDTDLVPVDYNDHPNAFLTGTVQAILTFEPNKSLILEKRGHVLYDTSSMPEEVVDILITRKAVSSAEKSSVFQVVKAVHTVVSELRKNPDYVIDVMASHESLSKEKFQKVLSGIKLLNGKEALQSLRSGKLMGQIKKTYSFMLKNKIIIEAPTNLNFINTEYLEALE